ncbi:MAG: preprotein translocase subunit YajC [Bacteroidetes bacterium]|uniref:Sec translocon accessory complex subunit YajC n=1 Tax=Candidatus Enterocola intestinipullorum TaxID=2840783 RepID=A0A9D9H9J2_9BACT|nr:preprotein translocase subunit YajC [Candidatus Enterocola intestinipullorum]
MNATVLLQAAGQAQGGMWTSLIMIVLIFVVMYFFMIRPNVKKQKEIKKFQDSLKNGDKVVTAGGIYGKVKDVKETEVLLEISQGVCITVDKNSVFATSADRSAAPAK